MLTHLYVLYISCESTSFVKGKGPLLTCKISTAAGDLPPSLFRSQTFIVIFYQLLPRPAHYYWPHSRDDSQKSRGLPCAKGVFALPGPKTQVQVHSKLEEEKKRLEEHEIEAELWVSTCCKFIILAPILGYAK